MEVYVEFAILDNFVMDYLILKLTLCGCPIKSGGKRVVIAALLGTVFAVYLPLLDLSRACLLIFKVAFGPVMVVVAAEFQSFKNYCLRTILLFLITFAFGGTIYGFAGLFGVEYDAVNNVYAGSPPLFLLLGGAAVCYLVLYKAFSLLYKKKSVAPFLRKCVLYSGEHKLRVNAFIDSGNGIIYKNFYSVCVADASLSAKMEKCGFLQGRLIGSTSVRTATGNGKINIYELDRIKVLYGENENIILNAKIGVVDSHIDFDGDFSLILPSDYA